MTFSLSEEAQTIKVFNLRADTHEFIGAGDAYIPPHTVLPANCTMTAPRKFLLARLLSGMIRCSSGRYWKTIAARPSMTPPPGRLYLFLNLVRCRRTIPGWHRPVSIRSGTVRPW